VTRDRVSILQDLVQYRRHLDELASELAGYDWDSQQRLVELSRADVCSVLSRYVDDKLDADQCRNWAEALLGRDDIGMEHEHESVLKDLLFWMSTPEINQPMTPALAREWIRRLRVP
jgi:hypothetical protein